MKPQTLKISTINLSYSKFKPQCSVSVENVGNIYNNAVIRILLACSILSKRESLVPKAKYISFHYSDCLNSISFLCLMMPQKLTHCQHRWKIKENMHNTKQEKSLSVSHQFPSHSGDIAYLLYSMLNNVFFVRWCWKIPQHHVNLKRVGRVVYLMWILLNFSIVMGCLRADKSSCEAIPRTLFCNACHWQTDIIWKWLILNHIQHIGVGAMYLYIPIKCKVI